MTAPQFPTGRYPVGHVLFERGDPATIFYIIQSGEVDLDLHAGLSPLARLGAGDAFGEQAILTGGVRSARAMVVSDLVCVEITPNALRGMLGNQRSFLSPVFEALLLQLCMQNVILDLATHSAAKLATTGN